MIMSEELSTQRILNFKILKNDETPEVVSKCEKTIPNFQITCTS